MNPSFFCPIHGVVPHESTIDNGDGLRLHLECQSTVLSLSPSEPLVDVENFSLSLQKQLAAQASLLRGEVLQAEETVLQGLLSLLSEIFPPLSLPLLPLSLGIELLSRSPEGTRDQVLLGVRTLRKLQTLSDLVGKIPPLLPLSLGKVPKCPQCLVELLPFSELHLQCPICVKKTPKGLV